MDIAKLIGHSFGPHQWQVSAGAVADFVTVTGDDPGRWTDSAPPGFMAAALFAVAPDLLGRLTEQSVIHGGQSFVWHRQLEVGADLVVTGTVTKARERGGVYFTTFEMETGDEHGTVAAGSSLFLISGDSAVGSAASERPEPAQDDRGSPADGQISASRADLVRYAAATRDWNPIHWDHESGVAAGLPGVVAHGLLQASWAFRFATEMTSGNRPLRSARVRFRNPLLPASVATIKSAWSDTNVNITIADEDFEYISARIELADE